MSLAFDSRAQAAFKRLAPHLLKLTHQAAREALRLHSKEVAIEHLLCAAMCDEDCAAYEVVCHAFADPDTIFEESLALAPGLLVVASASTLPFSEGAVRALFNALGDTRADSEEEVNVARIAAAAYRELAPSQHSLLATIGFAPEKLLAGAAHQNSEPEALFSFFDEDAKKGLSRSNRSAASLGASEIGPVHLFLGCLQVDASLGDTLGLNFSRARLTLSQDHLDPTPAPERQVPLDAALFDLLERLPEGGDSLSLMRALHAGPTTDLATLLGRHRVTPELLDRSTEAFRDPEDGSEIGA